MLSYMGARFTMPVFILVELGVFLIIEKDQKGWASGTLCDKSNISYIIIKYQYRGFYIYYIVMLK